MNECPSTPNNTWTIFERGGLRFYTISPFKNIEIYFTTRRRTDFEDDHNLSVADQINALRLSDSLVTMKQTHSDKILRVERPCELEADGCFSTSRNIALIVRVADCVPVFLWSKKGSLTGVVHAGWRGTLEKIVLRFAEKVEKELGIRPGELNYSLGPSIGGRCYRVQNDVMDNFRSLWPEALVFFEKNRHGLFLDLRAANRFLLNSIGATEICSLNLCTHCETRRFYSHRREPEKGRNWGIILSRSEYDQKS